MSSSRTTAQLRNQGDLRGNMAFKRVIIWRVGPLFWLLGAKSMNVAKVITTISLLFTVGCISGSVYFSSAMNITLSRNNILPAILIVLFLSALSCWPWLVAFSKSNSPEKKLGAVIFSVASALAAAFFGNIILHAPSEGVGYFVIIFILSVWIVGPFLLCIRSRQSKY
jgi:hypothetical protein